MRRLVACLACRNNGSRLYGKPLQNLSIEKSLTILDYQIQLLKTISVISKIVLAISEGNDNIVFIDYAKKHNISYIIGSEINVLNRLIDACIHEKGTDIFRVTTESPYTYFEGIKKAWEDHQKFKRDFTKLDNVPDGANFEIIRLQALNKSQEFGEEKHKSELCSLYIRENPGKFIIGDVTAPDIIKRPDIRLTVDYPEDLILCRNIYNSFEKLAPRIPISKIINYIDENSHVKNLVDKYVDDGLKNMYV